MCQNIIAVTIDGKYLMNVFSIESLVMCLWQRSLTEIILPPPLLGEHLSISGDIFVTNGGGSCYWHLVGGGQVGC